MTINRQLYANNALPSVSTLWWCIMQRQRTLWYRLNARKSVDRDEPWVTLCNDSLAVISHRQTVNTRWSNPWHIPDTFHFPCFPDVVGIRESMVDCLRDQLIPPASLLVSGRGFSRAWKPGDEPVGSGWSRRQSTMDYLSHPWIIYSKYIYFIQ